MLPTLLPYCNWIIHINVHHIQSVQEIFWFEIFQQWKQTFAKLFRMAIKQVIKTSNCRENCLRQCLNEHASMSTYGQIGEICLTAIKTVPSLLVYHKQQKFIVAFKTLPLLAIRTSRPLYWGANFSIQCKAKTTLIKVAGHFQNLV